MKISKFEILTNFQKRLKYKRANKNSKSFDKFNKKDKRKFQSLKNSYKFKKNIKFKRINKNSKSFSNLRKINENFKVQTLTYFQYKFTRNVIKRVKKNSSRRIRNIKE